MAVEQYDFKFRLDPSYYQAYTWKTIQGSYLNPHSDWCYQWQESWWGHYPYTRFELLPRCDVREGRRSRAVTKLAGFFLPDNPCPKVSDDKL